MTTTHKSLFHPRQISVILLSFQFRSIAVFTHVTMRLLNRAVLRCPSDVQLFRRFCSNEVEKRICIVGGGPAGFYSAQYLASHLPNCRIDVLEKLPVPFGLVRYGVAPDHPEVKNVINTFTKTARLPNVKFMGNLTLGVDYCLKDLQERYHCVLLTYGAERDRQLGLPDEDRLPKVISAREFVAFYNGLPGAENLQSDLSGRSVSIVGQGNVAIDVARILLSPLEQLAKTDITETALEALSASHVKRVNVIGRRGPLQAAFTIKELREMIKLPNVKSVWRPEDFEGIAEVVKDLPRPRRRITELMLDSLSKQPKSVSAEDKVFAPIFLRSPESIEVTSGGQQQLHLTVNKLEGDRAEATNGRETVPSDLILRSIGYKSISYDPQLNFNDRQGLVNNIDGRVLRHGSEEDVEPGLYTGGWLATGPTGVILTTMNNAFRIASMICEDFKNDKVPNSSEAKPGLSAGDSLLAGKQVVDWAAWERIDEAEQGHGARRNKPREKFYSTEDMLRAAFP